MDTPQPLPPSTAETAWAAELESHIASQIKAHDSLQKYDYDPAKSSNTDNSFFLDLIELEFGPFMRSFTDADLDYIWGDHERIKQTIAKEPRLSQQDTLKMLESLSTSHPLKDLYSILYRVQCNMLAAWRCCFSLCERRLICENDYSVTLANPHCYKKQHQAEWIKTDYKNAKDKNLLCYLGYHDRDKRQRKFCLVSPTLHTEGSGCDFFPDCRCGFYPLTLAQLNIYSQLKVHDRALLEMLHNKPVDEFLRPALCVQEGICIYSPQENIYKLFFPTSLLRLLHNNCKRQVLAELEERTVLTHAILSRTTIIKYSMPDFEEGILQTLRQEIKHAMKQHELKLTMMITEPESRTVTLICKPKPQWRFQKNQCSHQQKNQANHTTVYCLRPVTDSEWPRYCDEHSDFYEKRCSANFKCPTLQEREHQAYGLRPNLKIRDQLNFPSKVDGSDTVVTLSLVSVSYEPFKVGAKVYCNKQCRPGPYASV
jgi:hypothetical protein